MQQNSTALYQHINKLNQHHSLTDFNNILEFALYKGSSINSNAFCPLLQSDHAFYIGKSLEDIRYCKASIFDLFEKIGTDRQSLPYIIEALEISSTPLLVAAAAKGIRGLQHSMPQLAHILIEGFYAIHAVDEEMVFEKDGTKTTAVSEILKTIKWFGKDAAYVLPELKIILREFNSSLTQKHEALLLENIQFLENISTPQVDYSKLSLEECYNTYSHLNKTMIKKKEKSFAKNIFRNFSTSSYFSFFQKSLKLD